jgi:prepilin-type N-terminal cleavage/methylation domain-containing protein
MRSKNSKVAEKGFSLLELMITMAIMLVALALVTSLFARSLAVRSRESSRTDALTSAQAALNVMSREIGNTGYGLVGNGIVYADSNLTRLHVLANIVNTNSVLTDPGENITFFYDPVAQSILRYDANDGGTSVLINRVSNVNFQYFDYTGTGSIGTQVANPTVNTARVRIILTVTLDRVQGQANPQAVVLVSDVTLRNSPYMLQQY